MNTTIRAGLVTAILLVALAVTAMAALADKLDAPQGHIETSDSNTDQLCATAPSGSGALICGYLMNEGSHIAMKPLDTFVLAASKGAKCDGFNDDTNALNATFAYAAAFDRIAVLPPGICMYTVLNVPAITVQGQGEGITILKREGGQSGSGIIPASFATLKRFSIDGNKAAQTVGACGLTGYQVQGIRIEDVTVQNVLGMGDCFQDSAHILHIRETATGIMRPSPLTNTTGADSNNGSGFWTASYTASSFFNDGDSQYIDCISEYNDLDGIEFGIPNITIRGGRYDHNGLFTDVTLSDQQNEVHTKLLGGALGAAGLYWAATVLNPIAINAVISGVHTFENSESGMDIVLGKGSVAAGNVSHDNGTFGYLLQGPTGVSAGRFTFSGNFAYNNGEITNATWTTGNPDIELHVGIALHGAIAYATITGNNAYEDRAPCAGGTQKYGLYALPDKRIGTPAFSNLTVADNSLRYNLSAGTNLSGTPPASVTNLIYCNKFE